MTNVAQPSGQLYLSAAAQQLSTDVNKNFGDISITLIGERNVYVVWVTNNTEGSDSEIIFRSSNDNGTTFREPINLSNSTGIDSIDPQVIARGRNVYVVWWEIDRNNNSSAEPTFIASHNFGQTFGEQIKLMNGSISEPLPITQNDTAMTPNNNNTTTNVIPGINSNITRNETTTSIPSSDGNFTVPSLYQ